MAGSFTGEESPALSHKSTSLGSGYQNQMAELSLLRRENDDLKLELVKARMQLKELQKPSVSSPFSGKPPLLKKSIMNCVQKNLATSSCFFVLMALSLYLAKPGRSHPKIGRTRSPEISISGLNYVAQCLCF